MSDRKPPAKTGDPACGARATRRDGIARTWRRAVTLSGLLLALLGVGLALATPRKSPAARRRKTYRFRLSTKSTFFRTPPPVEGGTENEKLATPPGRRTALPMAVSPDVGQVVGRRTAFRILASPAAQSADEPFSAGRVTALSAAERPRGGARNSRGDASRRIFRRGRARRREPPTGQNPCPP